MKNDGAAIGGWNLVVEKSATLSRLAIETEAKMMKEK